MNITSVKQILALMSILFNYYGELIFPCADPEGGGGGRSLENHKNIGFLSNTGLDSSEKS